MMKTRIGAMGALVGASLLTTCDASPPVDSAAAQEDVNGNPTRGRAIFRHQTYGDEQLWTDQLQMHTVIENLIDPITALTVAGLKVDSSAVPPEVLSNADLTDPATTVLLIGLGAVVGLNGTLDENGHLESVGITCALCHSTVDDSVDFGIGSRLDGWPNRDLDPGYILSLSPAIHVLEKEVLQTWGPGYYDPRHNVDGLSDPVLIPPIYGLAGVALQTYTGDGPISYWNSYVGVTQMGGLGDFSDSRIGVAVDLEVDEITRRLPALLVYQLTLKAPPPPAGSFDSIAAARGKLVFAGAGRCATCHVGPAYTDAGTTLHAAGETGVDPFYARRSATKAYRTTPLRALWQHPPYFHDGSMATLEDVVDHYDDHLDLDLSGADRDDLVEFLKSL